MRLAVCPGAPPSPGAEEVVGELLEEFLGGLLDDAVTMGEAHQWVPPSKAEFARKAEEFNRALQSGTRPSATGSPPTKVGFQSAVRTCMFDRDCAPGAIGHTHCMGCASEGKLALVHAERFCKTCVTGKQKGVARMHAMCDRRLTHHLQKDATSGNWETRKGELETQVTGFSKQLQVLQKAMDTLSA